MFTPPEAQWAGNRHTPSFLLPLEMRTPSADTPQCRPCTGEPLRAYFYPPISSWTFQSSCITCGLLTRSCPSSISCIASALSDAISHPNQHC